VHSRRIDTRQRKQFEELLKQLPPHRSPASTNAPLALPPTNISTSA
jgi:hypothetical protein